MKRKLNKISMVVVATIMFAGTLFLTMEKDGAGDWAFVPVSTFAQSEGGESSGPKNQEYACQCISIIGGKLVVTQTGNTCITGGVVCYANPCDKC